jgi:hypothetical protein
VGGFEADELLALLSSLSHQHLTSALQSSRLAAIQLAAAPGSAMFPALCLTHSIPRSPRTRKPSSLAEIEEAEEAGSSALRSFPGLFIVPLLVVLLCVAIFISDGSPMTGGRPATPAHHLLDAAVGRLLLVVR